MARWYIIHAYSGFENKVRDAIITEAESATGRENQIDAARDAFYRGFVAEAIEDYLWEQQAGGVALKRLEEIRAGRATTISHCRYRAVMPVGITVPLFPQ